MYLLGVLDVHLPSLDGVLHGLHLGLDLRIKVAHKAKPTGPHGFQVFLHLQNCMQQMSKYVVASVCQELHCILIVLSKLRLSENNEHLS